MFLEHLDTFIAFAVVMLGVSLLITILTQLVSGILGLRGRNLKLGIRALFQRVSEDLTDEEADTIADAILRNNLISGFVSEKLKKMSWRLASAIRIEDLKLILQKLNSDEIKKLTRKNIAQEKIGRLKGKANEIEKWFNSVMDRTSQIFAMRMRIFTIIFSIIIAFALQLDSFKLLTQLSSDAEMRSSLVNHSEAMMQKADEILKNTISKDASTPENDERDKAIKAKIDELKNQSEGIINELDEAKFRLIPKSYTWEDCWPHKWHFWGIIASAAFLSLGAPFWFNILKNLSNLRPLLASKIQKEDEEAKESDKPDNN